MAFAMGGAAKPQSYIMTFASWPLTSGLGDGDLAVVVPKKLGILLIGVCVALGKHGTRSYTGTFG